MLNKIFTSFSSFIAAAFIFSTTIFTGTFPAHAVQMSSDNNGNSSLSIEIEESVDTSDVSKANSAPDLGDDQAFPFIPGFGKNSGKD